MKIRDFFSHIGYSIHSIFSYKRRNLSLGAGIVLGAAIFSSIFFYGSLVNTIAVQDIVNDIEGEVFFYPSAEANITESPTELKESILENREFSDAVVFYGDAVLYEIEYRTSFYLIENESSEIIRFPWFEDFTANIFNSQSQESEIIQKIKVVKGELNFSNGGCLLSDAMCRKYALSLGEKLHYNLTIGQIVIHPNGYTFTSLYYSLVNLTVTGFFQSEYFNEDAVIFSSANQENELMERLANYKLYSFLAKLDYSELPVNDLQELNKEIDKLVQKVEIQNEGMILGTNIVSTFLGENQIRIIIMQLIDTILYIPAIFLSLILTTSGTELSLQERKYEVSSLKSQGASPKQIKQMIYSEVVIVGLLASVIGILIGSVISSTVLSISRFMSVDFSTFGEAFRTIKLTPLSILGTIFISMCVAIIATLNKTKSFISEEVVEGVTIDKKKPNLLKRIYADFIIFLIGIVGVILHLIEDLNPEVSFGFSTVLVQFLSPVCLWFGASFIASRVATKVPELIDKFIIKIFKDVGMLIKGSLSRRNQHFPRISVLLCLSVSLCVLAAIQGYTGDMAIERQAEYLTGGDLKVEILTSSLSLSETNFTGFEEQIESVVPIYYANLKFSLSATYYRTAHCYGADISKYKDEAVWHKDSIANYKDWREGLLTIENDPLETIAVSKTVEEIIDAAQNSTLEFASHNSYLPSSSANAEVIFDHLPAIENNPSYYSDINVLADKEFLLTNFKNDTRIIRAIVNLKPNLEITPSNIQRELVTSFDWISEVYTYDDILKEVEDMQGRFYGIPGLLSVDYIIGISSTLIGISIFMFMIINKRKREFAILTAEGTSKKQIIKLVICEIISIALFSTIFGFVIGLLSAYQFNTFFDVFDLATFNRLLQIPVTSLVLTVICSFIAIILATLIPAISASRINVVEEMRTY